MTVKITPRSRLLYSALVTVDGVEFFDLPEFPDLLVQADDLSYVVKAGDRIDLLAQQFYGDPVLWWVIALANDMELLPTDMQDGVTLRIPSPRYVNSIITAQRRVFPQGGR